jgi:hypothetical protein
MLVALTFKPINVSVDLWDRLDVLFLDDNRSNLHPENLVWKFPVGLLNNKYPDFAYIPYFTNYGISKDGVVINFRTNKICKNHSTKKGYIQLSIKPDIGVSISIGRHRLIGLAWLDYNKNIDSLVVNHLNAIPGDDRIENLEWCTYAENTRHAVKLGRINNITELKPVLCRFYEKNEVIEYPSIGDCANEHGVDPSSIYYRIISGNQYLCNGLTQFKYKHDLTTWRKPSPREIIRAKYPGYCLRNLKTNEEKIFDNLKDISEVINLNEKQTSYHLRKNKQVILSNYYQIKYEYNKWRKPKNIEKEHNKSLYKNIVLLRDLDTNEILEFKSAIECSKYLGLNPLTVSSRLRNNKDLIFNNKYQFKLKADQRPWRDVDKGLKENNAKSNILVKIKDIFSGDVSYYNSLKEAELDKSIPFHILEQRINGVEKHPYFQYEICSINNDFKKHTKLELELFKSCISFNISLKGRGYKLTDITTKEIKLYPSPKLIAKEFSITEGHVKDMARDNLTFRNKWRFEYFY